MTLPTEDVAALVARLLARNERFQATEGSGLFYGGGDSILDSDAATALSTLAGERDENFADAKAYAEAAKFQRLRAEAAEARATTAEAQVVAMREALEPFADAANSYDPDEDDGHTVAWNHDFTLASLRRARTALLAGTPPSGAETQEKVDGN